MSPAPAGNQAAQIRAHLLELLGPLVTAEGYDLEDVTVTAAGRRSMVRVIVDADGGIDLDGVAAISRAASEALDDTARGGPDFADPYVLEVSSPGVDRPLTEPRHWRRAIGRLVQTQHQGRSVTGRIVATSDDGVTLAVPGPRKDLPVQLEVAWADLGPGKVQVEFSRPGKADNALDGDALDDEHDDESGEV
jgi:ribosome maturation factor RimP